MIQSSANENAYSEFADYLVGAKVNAEATLMLSFCLDGPLAQKIEPPSLILKTSYQKFLIKKRKTNLIKLVRLSI